MFDVGQLEKWIKRRKALLAKAEPQQEGKAVGLPNGLTIHVNIDNKGESAQKLPLTADGSAVATRDAVARYPG